MQVHFVWLPVPNKVYMNEMVTERCYHKSGAYLFTVPEQLFVSIERVLV